MILGKHALKNYGKPKCREGVYTVYYYEHYGSGNSNAQKQEVLADSIEDARKSFLTIHPNYSVYLVRKVRK